MTPIWHDDTGVTDHGIKMFKHQLQILYIKNKNIVINFGRLSYPMIIYVTVAFLNEKVEDGPLFLTFEYLISVWKEVSGKFSTKIEFCLKSMP